MIVVDGMIRYFTASPFHSHAYSEEVSRPTLEGGNKIKQKYGNSFTASALHVLLHLLMVTLLTNTLLWLYLGWWQTW